MNENQTYANCRVSAPILYSENQDVTFNGFAWSNAMGMIHQTVPVQKQGWQQWLGTQQ